MSEMDELLNSLFFEVEIPIVNCPPGLEGAQVEYADKNLEIFGIVKNGKLVAETADEIPEGAVITWGQGTWKISW